jgi:hypothetical protein
MKYKYAIKKSINECLILRHGISSILGRNLVTRARRKLPRIAALHRSLAGVSCWSGESLMLRQKEVVEGMKSLKKSMIGAVVLGAFTMAPTAAIASGNVDLWQIPRNYALNGFTYPNLEGYVVNIQDYRNLQILAKNLITHTLPCEIIHPSTVNTGGASKRDSCYSGYSYTCDNLYSNTAYNPGTLERKRMVPNLPVSYWVNEAKKNNTSKNYIGLNLGFFNTKPLQGRSFDEARWKPIYEEACGRTMGVHRRINGGTTNPDTWYSQYSDLEQLPDAPNGIDDQNFGALWKANGYEVHHDELATSNPPSSTFNNAHFAFSGVYVRWNGSNKNKTHSYVPQFVQDKWDSVVGRTAVGFNTSTKKMRFVVIQPGRDANGTGASVPTIRDLVGSTTAYPYVMLLDGSGSSQLASTTAAQTVPQDQYLSKRTDCGHQHNGQANRHIRSCSDYGDRVGYMFVDHQSNEYKKSAGGGNFYVDRPVPAVIVFEDN